MTTTRRRLRRWSAAAAAGALLVLGAPGIAAAQEEEGRMDAVRDAEVNARRVSMDEAVEVALRNSPALRQAAADVDEARTQTTSAVGSFLPDLSLDYGFSDASTGRLDPTGQAIITTSFDAQLNGSIEILDGFRRFNQMESARKQVTAQRATFEQQRYDVMLDVKTAFLNAVAARERIQVEQDRVERQLDQLEFVRQQIRLGQATRADSLSSRVDLNNARLALINARNEARAAQFALAEAMGVRQRVAPVEQAALEPDTLAYDRERLMAIAQRQAPRIRSARLSSDAAEAQVDTQKSGYFPSLQLSGGWAWQNAEFPPKDRSWSLSIRGSLPLFDGLQRETQVAAAEARAMAAEAQARTAELAVRSDVDDAYSQIQTALAGLEVAEESVELSRENLRVAQQRYRLGASTILDLEAAQIDLQQAELDVIERQFDYQVGLARLESLLGTDLDASGETGGGGVDAGSTETRFDS
jgi:outer membrane protein TolC